MKLKKLIAPILAICLAFGVCTMAVACGEDDPPDQGKNPSGQTPGGETPGGETPGGETPGGETPGGSTNTDDLTFTVNISAAGAKLDGVKALFYNSENSKLADIANDKASATLPKGEYVVYLTGVIDGFLYTPIRLSSFVTEASLPLRPATPNANGDVPVQVLYLLEPDKVFEADIDNDLGQICNTNSCYNPTFDEFFVCGLNTRGTDQFYIEKSENFVHEPTGYPKDKYSFDDTKYQAPENGGFISVVFDKK